MDKSEKMERRLRIRDKVLLDNGSTARLVNIDVSFLVDEDSIASSYYVNPILEAIDHPLLVTKTFRDEGKIIAYEISLMEYGGEGSYFSNTIEKWRIDYTKRRRSVTYFEKNINSFRKYELTLDDIANLMIKLHNVEETWAVFKASVNAPDDIE